MLRSIHINKKNLFSSFKRHFSIAGGYPEVEISHGKLRGIVATNIDNERYYKFQGIPYAQPPTGKLRFKPPLPVDPWPGILDASKEGSPCCGRQKENSFIGRENCLFLNVYTRNLDEKSLRPVMFEIHGGGFLSGSGGSDSHGPDFLLTQDIVLVTLNYRLGIFGFLCLEDPSLGVSGNMGLKDIVMALRWLQLNIHKFGGDSNNVTIMGQSSGGVVVHLLMLLELGRGLFHKAIAQSGCALHPWAQGTKGITKIADVVRMHDERAVYECLMKMSLEELHKIQNAVDNDHLCVPNLERPFGYVVESPTKDALIAEAPEKPMLQAVHDIPFMIGYTSAESLRYCLARKCYWPGFQSCEDMIPCTFGYTTGSEESLAVASQMRKYYLGSDKWAVSNMQTLLMNSDLSFVYWIYAAIASHLQRSSAPVYCYRVSVETKLNLIKSLYNINLPGVAHYDEVGYLFKNTALPEITPNTKEDVAMRRFVKLWTNFAKYGNPTPDEDNELLQVTWHPVSNRCHNYLEIGNDLVACQNPEELSRMLFLKQLFQK